MDYLEALARLIQEKEQLDYFPVIKNTNFDQGGDFQIGEMTWDHDNATFTVKYRDPRHTPGKTHEFRVDFETYNLYYDGPSQANVRQHPSTIGFAGFLNELLEVAEKSKNGEETDSARES